jgi:hypothetical protein
LARSVEQTPDSQHYWKKFVQHEKLCWPRTCATGTRAHFFYF